ncbi:MAG: ComEC/Rec2 family competence protein [Candidatus Cyclobacteriaceae bacterium M2_1C_046]
MLRWLPYPFIRILLFFVIGIVFGIYSGLFSFHIYLLLLSLCILAFVAFLLLRLVFKENIFSGIIFFAAIVLTGLLHGNISLKGQETAIPSDFFVAVIDGYPEKKQNYTRYEALLTYTDTISVAHKSRSKIYLYVNKKDSLSYGDVLISDAGLYGIEPPKNPGEFDYRQYLIYKNIYAQGFLKAGQFKIIDHQPPSQIIGSAYSLRASIEKKIDEHMMPEEASLLKALLIGIRNDIDDNILDAYAAAGAIHILAVSGLHVGIIYGLLLLILKSFRKTKEGKLIFAILVLTTLWFYAFVTGFSPSVFRAVTMFSFIVIGQALNRKSSIYNSIAASAFILLFFNPLLIMQVGFQLSYLAVIGIVYLYPKIISLWEPENNLVDKIWQLTAVGVAAQIATFPLGLFYFHQFPTWFIFSNLLVIPLATLILFSGIAFLTVSWWNLLSGLIATVITFLIKLMNQVVLFIEKMPISIINEVYFSPFELLLLCMVVIFFILTFTRKNIKAFYSFSFLAIILIGSVLFSSYTLVDDKVVQFYSIRGNTVVDFVDGDHLYTFTVDTTQDVNYFTGSFRERRHLKSISFPSSLMVKEQYNSWIEWKDQLYYFAYNTPEAPHLLSKADILYIDNEAIETDIIVKYFKGKLLILGASNNKFYKQKVFEALKSSKIQVHDLQLRAFTLNL